ncbi:MAG: amidase family protein [Roseicyclus sp.]
MSDLAQLSATDCRAGYAAGEITPVEVIRAVLDRLALVEPAINAFAHVDEAGALAAAKASEARWRAGAPLGPLDGVPVSVKDMLPTRGMPTRKGSRTTDPDAPRDVDAPAVARLRAGGAVLYGKTTTTEFGGSPYSSSPLTGVTRSPWHLGHGVSGSSMGTAAQLAAGVGTLGLANDAAGSIRMPASFGGCFGIKPSFGLVATWPPSAAGILGHTGPMGWGVAEVAGMLAVIAGPDPRDPYALPRGAVPLDPGPGALDGLRVAYSPSLGIRPPDPEVRALTDAAARTFADLGAEVTEVDPDLSGLFEAYDCLRICNRARAYRASGAAGRKGEMDEIVARVIGQAQAYGVDDYVAALAHRETLASRMRRFHERHDLLLTPTMATLPLPIGTGPGPGDAHWYQIGGKVWSPYTFAFNMTQQPAASIPCGLASRPETPGILLPVGLQIVGAPYADALVLRAALAYETTRDWARPAFPFTGGEDV